MSSERKFLDIPAEIKALGDNGEFSGYASVFGNVDLGGDVVERGAFKQLATTRDGYIRVLYQHDSRRPIGKALVREDQTGLAFDGKLVLADAVARSAYEMMKAGILDGMSIGYDVLPGEAEHRSDGTRVLRGVKLWEISPVTFGMNPLAGITSVKDVAKQCTNIREFEALLRDVGFSREQAKVLASSWKLLPGQRDAEPDGQRDADPATGKVVEHPLVSEIIALARGGKR